MTQRKKNKILIVVAIISLILTYHLGITKTVSEYYRFVNLKGKSKIFQNNTDQFKNLKELNIYYDSLLIDQKWTGISLQYDLLNALTSYAPKHGIYINKFSNPYQVILEDGVLNTYSFSVRGSYNNLISLINWLEQMHNFGEIIHLSFIKKNNRKSNTDYLELEVLLQSTLHSTNTPAAWFKLNLHPYIGRQS